MQIFSEDATLFSKKNSNLFFAHENIKNGPQKLLIIGPKLFFHKYGPAAQTSPELIFHIINMSQDSSVSLSEILGVPIYLLRVFLE